jgi:hypothetical protein
MPVTGDNVPEKPAVTPETQGTGLTEDGPFGALLGKPRWCVWSWVLRDKAKRWTKQPFRAVPPNTEPWAASSNRGVEQGRTYDLARDTVLRGDADGVGWFVMDEPDVVWLDLDKCRDPVSEDLAPWAFALLDRCPDAYVEITPSGEGLRIVGTGLDLGVQCALQMRAFLAGLDAEGLRLWGGSCEAAERAQIEVFYSCKRYMTVTGNELEWRRGGSVRADVGRLALEIVAAAGTQPGARKGGGGGGDGRAKPPEELRGPIEDVRAALEMIPNGAPGEGDPVDWHRWKEGVGMAVWGATGGSVEGLEAWAMWSAKAEDLHDPDACEAEWEHLHRSPADKKGIGWLMEEAKAAAKVKGVEWKRPTRTPEREFGDATGEVEAAAGGVGGADRPGGAGGGSGGVGADADLSPFERLGRRLVHVMKDDKFYDTASGLMLDRSQVGALGAELDVGISAGATGKKSTWAQLLDHPNIGLQRAAALTMLPGEDLLVEVDGRVCVNQWRPSRLVPSDADASVWLDHMRFLIPDEADRERVLDRMAFGLQRLGVKINSALVLLGKQGTGKDMALDPFWAAIGQHNIGMVPGAEAGDRFNDHMLKPWVLMSEMPSYRKRSVYEEIKAMLTTPPDMIRINTKNVKAYDIPNLTNVIVTTNHPDAIALAEEDRRFDVVATVYAADAAGIERGAYYTRLREWLDSGGQAAVMGWLMRRDVTGFKAKGAPPVTAAKAVMIGEAEPAPVAWARMIWGEGGPLGGREIVTMAEIMTMVENRAWAPGNGEAWRGRQLMTLIERAFRADEWVNIPIQVREGAVRARPWVRGGQTGLVAQMSGPALRERLEKDRARCSVSEF